MTTKNDQNTQIAIAGVISELTRLLAQSAAVAAQAQDAINKGDRNLAVGTLLGVEAAIQSIAPLFAATLSLHRNH